MGFCFSFSRSGEALARDESYMGLVENLVSECVADFDYDEHPHA